jgi:cyclopropane fatty-acyl-phospholipid synthase-like methyltransferase
LGFWDITYQFYAPWEIGCPQPVLTGLIEGGEIGTGQVLDVGCGTGENAIHLAKNGFSVVGIDIAASAIRSAKAKANAVDWYANVDFKIGDALKLESYFDVGEFDAVIDFGFFHTLKESQRLNFIRQVYRLLRGGGKYFMMCFSDKESFGFLPRRISKDVINQNMQPYFEIQYIKDTIFESRRSGGARAYITSAEKPA